MVDGRHRFEAQVLPHLDAAYRFARWLLTIVKNCHFTALKRQQRRTFVPLPEEQDVQDGHAMIATTPDPESTIDVRPRMAQ
jgi:DNA-directed RNA polymerase specialized sigma24 family protein